ncbi:hypothetical protein [Hymenobacter chitinivorans]|uniref:hypothetical protein n=1 Tax=Hymenobacter chitinivorans TaxID=89969 RepID=UPI0012FD7E3C|nr:hypothetical protein [Hymenobacter chitinivorans]
MDSKLNSATVLSIFKRKGSEGLYTRVISSNNKHDIDFIRPFLNDNEEGLIIFLKDNLNWTILTNDRIISANKGFEIVIKIADIVDVDMALKEEFLHGVRDKNLFTRVAIIDINKAAKIIKFEAGLPYYGFVQVLHFLSRRNRDSLNL